MRVMFGLSDKDFKAAIVKMLQQSLTDLKPVKNRNLQQMDIKSLQRSRRCREEPNRKFPTGKYNKWNLKAQSMGSIAEWTG